MVPGSLKIRRVVLRGFFGMGRGVPGRAVCAYRHWCTGRVRLKPAQVEHSIVPSVDLYPTFLHLAGASVPKDRILDGKDIRPLLGWPGEVVEKPVFYYGPRTIHAVRHGPWKLHVRASSQFRSRLL